MTTLFPFAPNWRSTVQEFLAYNTEIITSRSGREQRRALRRSPRRSFEFLLSTMADGGYARMRVFLERYHHQVIAMADPVLGVPLATPWNAGYTGFSVASTPEWLTDGAELAVTGAGTVDIVQVSDVTAGSVTTGSPAQKFWPAGSVLRPLLNGRLAESVSGKTPVTTLLEAGRVRFDVTPTSESEQAIPVADAQYGGMDVMLRRPNYATAPEIEFVRPRQTVDYGTGPVSHTHYVNWQHRFTRAEYVGLTQAEALKIKAQFMRSRGQWGEIRVPTWERESIANAASGSTSIQVPGADFRAAYNNHPAYKVLMLYPRGGSPAYRRVSSIGIDAGASVINLTSALPFAIDETTLVCWLPVQRFASDELTLTWTTDAVCRVSAAFKTLEDQTT